MFKTALHVTLNTIFTVQRNKTVVDDNTGKVATALDIVTMLIRELPDGDSRGALPVLMGGDCALLCLLRAAATKAKDSQLRADLVDIAALLLPDDVEDAELSRRRRQALDPTGLALEMYRVKFPLEPGKRQEYYQSWRNLANRERKLLNRMYKLGPDDFAKRRLEQHKLQSQSTQAELDSRVQYTEDLTQDSPDVEVISVDDDDDDGDGDDAVAGNDGGGAAPAPAPAPAPQEVFTISDSEDDELADGDGDGDGVDDGDHENDAAANDEIGDMGVHSNVGSADGDDDEVESEDLNDESDAAESEDLGEASEGEDRLQDHPALHHSSKAQHTSNSPARAFGGTGHGNGNGSARSPTKAQTTTSPTAALFATAATVPPTSTLTATPPEQHPGYPSAPLTTSPLRRARSTEAPAPLPKRPKSTSSESHGVGGGGPGPLNLSRAEAAHRYPAYNGDISSGSDSDGDEAGDAGSDGDPLSRQSGGSTITSTRSLSPTSWNRRISTSGSQSASGSAGAPSSGGSSFSSGKSPAQFNSQTGGRIPIDDSQSPMHDTDDDGDGSESGAPSPSSSTTTVEFDVDDDDGNTTVADGAGDDADSDHSDGDGDGEGEDDGDGDGDEDSLGITVSQSVIHISAPSSSSEDEDEDEDDSESGNGRTSTQLTQSRSQREFTPQLD